MSSEKPVAFVTGGNMGIGLETSKQLSEKGFSVVIGAFDFSEGEAVVAELKGQGYDLSVIPLDLREKASIESAANTIRSDHGRLDVLVNNSAVLLDIGKQPTEVSDGEMRQTFEVNFFGPYFLTQQLAPLIMSSPVGRVVNMSTTVASLNQLADPDSPARDDICPAYQASKAALNVLTLVFAKQFTDSGTKAKSNSCCPGWVLTDMGEADELPDYGEGVKPKTPTEGADTPVWLATLPEDGPTGGFYSDQKPRAW